MAAGWYTRTVRAAVFAAVCVLLSALAHTMMSGALVPWWALCAGLVAAGGVGWALAGHERGLRVIVPVVVVTQAVLHWSFSLAQSAGQPAARANAVGDTGDMPMVSMDHPMSSGHDMSSMGMDHSVHVGSGAPAGVEQWLGGTSLLGMYAAHLVAALLCGLWLGYGERVAFRLLRVVAGWLAAPLRLVSAAPALPRRPRVLRRRRRTRLVPRRLHLVHAITPRGPPATLAVL
ncbi:hypothetical protein [Streptomyces doebereineriae]|uniref:Integral membrane protein n=1 Tax=Streptomyces doebereineriae TaxID=3075528 RepID=A0ABU2VJ64_9ACTN|nr:hypothetical protein [Streptomyces sp. DSM 41640]MDT0485629.1 hypothetical protein [Streptomyces sp. DSM 41640]